MAVEKTAGRRAGTSYLPFLGVFIVIILPLLALAHILSTRRKLRRASHRGRAVSASVSSNGTPLTTVNRSGNPGDPINMQISGTDGQIGAAFGSAGWYRADEIDFITSARISIDSILGRAYSTAPVSNLYLYGRKEDKAFERPGHNVRQRDHIRIWNTGRGGSDGRPIWIGSATKDTKVELSRTNHLPTHCIAPDLDNFNGGGDPYFTDGQVAVLTLANVWTSPLARQVRSPLGARIFRNLAGFLRHRLPEAGRNRAASEQDRLKQAAQVGS
jgi:hypothetical protein